MAEPPDENEDRLSLDDINGLLATLSDDISAEPDPTTTAELKNYDDKKKEAELSGLKLDIEQRKEFADKIFKLIVWWLIAIFSVLLLQGFGGRIGWAALSDGVMLALIGGTTANVLGIFAIVANYIFRKPQNPR